MADEKVSEASRLAPEKFIPEFNRLSVEGPNNDDDDDGPKKTLKPKRKHGKTNIKIQLRKTSSEVSNKKELRKASSEESKKKEEKKDKKIEEPIKPSYCPPYYAYGDVSGYYDGISHTRQHESYKEFGRDTNRLDYFPVSPLEVSYDSKYGESDCYGGGHSGQQQSAPSVNLVANDLRSSDNNRTQEQIYLKDRGLEQGGGGQFSRRLEVDNNGGWLGIQRQLLQLARQQAHIMNMLQDRGLEQGGGQFSRRLEVDNRTQYIPNIGLGTTENVHAEKADTGLDKYTKLVHYLDTTELSNCIIWFGLLGLVFWFSGLI